MNISGRPIPLKRWIWALACLQIALNSILLLEPCKMASQRPTDEVVAKLAEVNILIEKRIALAEQAFMDLPEPKPEINEPRYLHL